MQWALRKEVTRMEMMTMVKLPMRCELMRIGRATTMLRLRRVQRGAECRKDETKKKTHRTPPPAAAASCIQKPAKVRSSAVSRAS